MKLKNRLAALLALILLLCAPAYAAEDEDPVLFTFNGQEYHQSEVVRNASAYGQAQLISSETAYEEAIEYMITNQLVAEAKAAELGLDQYTDEELAEIKAEADQYYEEQLDAYTDALLPESTDAEKAEFRQSLKDYWIENGTTAELAEKTHLFNKTKARLLETMPVEITDEEIAEVFEEQIQKDEEFFKDNIKAYEYFTEYQQSDVWFVPEGYRGVLQILLYADDELTEAYKAAVEADEGVEEARQAILDSKQETIDEIYAKLDAGEDFVTVMQEYSEDPAMDETLIETGYAVHPESTIWVREFTAGAFSDKMQAVGDVSDPVVSRFGVHILYYLRDIPAGRVEFNDRIRESIVNYLTNKKRAETLASWAADYEVTYNQEAIDALKATVEE